MQRFWYILIGLIFLLILGFALLRKNKETKYHLDYVILRLPIFGKMLRISWSKRGSSLKSSFRKRLPTK